MRFDSKGDWERKQIELGLSVVAHKSPGSSDLISPLGRVTTLRPMLPGQNLALMKPDSPCVSAVGRSVKTGLETVVGRCGLLMR